ncbi:MAG: hypothetical protein LBT83_05655 [Tannerella sp.]|nr:hypothetical protein [Tannerella sp.]
MFCQKAKRGTYATHDGTAHIYGLTGQQIKALPHMAGRNSADHAAARDVYRRDKREEL